MLATLQTHKMAPAIYKGSISQPKLLMYKPIPELQENNVTARQINKTCTTFSSIGLAIPFQPTMWDEKSVHSVCNNAIELVTSKLKGRYSEEFTNTILARLEKLLSKLNYDTHRKSLAIILTPDEEKVFYLSFPVKPIVFLRKSVSLLDLAANMQQESHFYYLVLEEENACLYEYNDKQLRKVYEQNNEPASANIFKNASNTIELLNSKYERPVFVTGSPNMVENFCNSIPYSKQFFILLYQAAPFSTEIVESLINEITVHWSYWQSKFTKTKIFVAKEAGSLISHFDAVLRALDKCADGLLLVDKHLKQQLQKSTPADTLFQMTDEFMQQLEKFLVRGNRIEITEKGLMKDMGGIVLLQGNNKTLPAWRQSTAGGSLY
jgi:hypothetical protein